MLLHTGDHPVIFAVLMAFLASVFGAPVSSHSSLPSASQESVQRYLTDVVQPFSFSVYPEGGNGEVGYVAASDDDRVLEALDTLRGEQEFGVYLFTAWSWHNQDDLDRKIDLYTDRGYQITLMIKYSPPDGREGDADGYARFVSGVVQRYAENSAMQRFVIGNEANVTWGNPGSSDGPFMGVEDAIVHGVIAARRAIFAAGSDAELGFNIAITGRDYDAWWVQQLTSNGGAEFVAAVQFMGFNVYPGLWPEGTGDAYADMATYLGDARHALTAAGLGRSVSLVVLENGFPTPDDTDQAERLKQMVQAVCDTRYEHGVSGYTWFGLLDADSSSDNQFAHYGLLRSDLSARQSFEIYRSIVLTGCD